MDDPYAVDRRDFLKTGAVAAAATAVACGQADTRWRVLTADEAATLAAACDRIVPPDEDPGAAQAGVVAFVDRQLATRQKKELGGFFRAGIRGLDAAARRRHGKPFAELAEDAQVAALREAERGEGDPADWTEVEPGAFFSRLRWYTMMGFYGDPRHGGNQDRVAWRMIGVPDPPVRGRLHETPPPPALAPRPKAAAAAVPAVAAPVAASRKG